MPTQDLAASTASNIGNIMKRLLPLLALMCAPAFAESHVKLLFNIQTNSPLCVPAAGLSFGCLPKELRQAGVMAGASSDDPTVTAFVFLVTATMADGSTVMRTEVVKSTRGTYSWAMLWLASEPEEFSNVQVSVTAQRPTGDGTSGTTPGIEY
jgi:hypothetical protein